MNSTVASASTPGSASRSAARTTGAAVLRVGGLVAGLVVVRLLAGGGLSAVGLPGLLTGTVTAVLLLAAYTTLVRRLEKRSPVEVAVGGAARETIRGALIGVGLFTVTLAIIAMFGVYHIDGFDSFGAFGAALGTAVLAGVFEELLVRGVVFRLLERRLGTWLALVLSAVVFGVLHLGNEGATLVSAMAIALEAGVLLAMAYVATRRLWLPIGLHIAWNATETGIFGVPTSGVKIDGLLHSHLTGPALVSGGAFGVEGSLITVLTCLAAAVVLYRRARRHNHFTAPAWRRTGR